MTNHYLRGRLAAIALVTAATLGLAACSGSGSDTGASQPTGDTSALASAAQKAAEAIAARPTELSIGQKISKPVPAGKTIATINCGADACTIIDKLTATAAEELGWKTLEIPTDGTAQQIGNAWQQAIRSGVDGIVQAGASRPQIETYIQQAKAVDIPVVLVASIDKPGDGVLAVVQDGASSVPQGTNLGIWVANDAYASKQPNASVLFVTIPDFKVLTYIQDGWDKSIKQYCPGCKVDTLEVGLSSLQQSTDLVKSKLRSNPDIKYVVFAVQNIFDAVPPALKAAGVNVKIAGATPGDVTLTQLRSGQVNAQEAFPAYEEAYGALDVFVRHYAGVLDTEPPAPYAIPQWMMTKDNVPSDNVFPIVDDLVAQYEAAWGK